MPSRFLEGVLGGTVERQQRLDAKFVEGDVDGSTQSCDHRHESQTADRCVEQHRHERLVARPPGTTVGQIGDTSLMVMASLLITDELSDTRDELEEARNDAARETQSAVDDTEERVAIRIDAVSERVEKLAALLADG